MGRDIDIRTLFTADDQLSPAMLKIKQNTKDFVASERSQHRQMNFLLKETGGAAQQLSNVFVGPGGLTKGMQSLGGSAMEVSFLFEGLNATLGQGEGKIAKLIGAIAPWGLAVGAAVGGFVLLKDLFEDMNKPVEQYADSLLKVVQQHTNNSVQLKAMADGFQAVADKQNNAIKSSLTFKNVLVGIVDAYFGISSPQVELLAINLGLSKLEAEALASKFKVAAAEAAAMEKAEATFVEMLKTSGDTQQRIEAVLIEQKKIENDITQSYEARQRAAKMVVDYTRILKALQTGGPTGLAPHGPNAGSQSWMTTEESKYDPGKYRINDLPKQLTGVQTQLDTIHLKEEQMKVTFGEVWQVGFEEAGNFYSVAEEGNATLRDGIMEGVGGAWESVFGKANSLFEKLMQNMTAKLASNALNGLFKGLASLFPGGSFLAGLFGGFHTGGMIPKAHSGMDFRGISPARDIPVMVRGGEMVLTEGQQKAVGNNHVTLNVTAMDARSFASFLSQAEIRRVLFGSMNQSYALGKV